MRKCLLFLWIPLVSIFLLNFSAFSMPGGGYSLDYQTTGSDAFSLEISLDKFNVQAVTKDGVTYSNIVYPGKIRTKKQGWASLPYFGIPVQLPGAKNVDVQITSIQYSEIELDHPLLPSRGVIYRNQDPDEIPYEIDPASVEDELYPQNILETSDPYIIRKVRGQNIFVHPFQYNAVQQTLRVATSITVEVKENDEIPYNPLPKNLGQVNVEMDPIYKSIFVNYTKDQTKWSDEIGEFGDILVIYTSDYSTAIQDWIEWKQQKGYHVDELQVTSGSNVVSDIQSAYDNNNNLLYVLLLGDWDDIKTNTESFSGATAPVDPLAGCVVGTDDHHDIIIGRFSAASSTDVTAQGNKAIVYERDATTGTTWYKNALGIASDEGDGMGDDSEGDIAHIDNIHDGRLLPTTYTTCNEEYDPGASATNVQSYINNGVSVINYTGHGMHDYWATSSYSTTEASSATNGPMYYYAFSVACIVGEFHTGGDCLAEAMAKNPDGGSVANWMSTINQPWQPPMRGQDYANDLLIQGYDYSLGSGTTTTYGRTTFGSITFNAAELMVNESGGYEDWDTYKTWTIFGDPSVQVRTDEPQAITITNPTVTPGTYDTQITVGGSAFEGAIVSLWQSGSQPASAVTDASGNVSIDHSFTGTVKLTVTGFNLATYSEDHTVESPDPPAADFSADQTSITEGETVNFTDLSTNSPTSWSWDFGDGNTSTDQNPAHQYSAAGIYTVELTATNSAGSDTETKTDYITVNENTNPPVAEFEANQTNIDVGGTVDFADLSTNNPDNWEWTFNGGDPGASTAQNPTVTYDLPGTYTVELTATNSYGSDTETKVDYITVTAAGFSMDFEDCADYSADFSPWSVYDGDGQDTYGSSDCNFPGENDTMSFMAFNPSDAGFDGIANAHGGVRVGMSICPDDGSESDDWLISNQLSLGDNSSFTLWALSPKPGTWGNDSYEVLVSTASDDPADFTNDISGGAVEAPDTWTEHFYDLSAYDNQDIYLAIHHVSADKFMLWVDDMEIDTEWSTPLTADFTADNTTVPVNGTVNFTDLSTGSPTSWSWDFGDGGTSTNENPDHTYTTTGTYTVELTISDGTNNNTETKIDYITVTEAAPVADFTASPTYSCDGNIQFTDESSNADTWEWDFGDGNTSADQNPLHTYASDGIYTVSLTVTNGAGSDTHTETDFITVEIPDATIDPVSDLCENDSPVTLTAATNGGTWDGPGVSAGEFDPASAGSGNHTITYEVTIGSCTDSDTEIIHVDAMPDASIDPVDDLCENDDPVTLTAATGGGTWSGTAVISGEFYPASAGPGDYIISYEVTNGQCTASDDINIHVDAMPEITIDPVSELCVGDSPVTLSAAPAGGSWSGPGVTGDQFDPSSAGIGTHTVYYEVIDGACSATDNIQITVSDYYDATIDAVAGLCESDAPITLTAADGGGTWSGDGITDQSAGTFDPSVAGSGDHTITYEITGSCGDSDTEIIHVDAMPDASITNPGAFCLVDPETNLSAATSGGTWSGTGITDSNNGTFDPGTAGIGTHTITYTVSNGTCTATDQIDLYVSDGYDATIDAVGDLCESDAPITLTAADGGGAWSGTGITDQSAGTFDPAVAGPGDFLISYTIEGSCGDSDDITIHVDAMPDINITNIGPFCEGDDPVSLSATPADGTWSGNGISSGEFSPTSAGIGTHTITYEVINGTCTATESIDVTVYEQPDATIDDPGPLCVGDDPVTLTAATSGGTWSGDGVSGNQLDPAAAGMGYITISYEVQEGSCSDSDEITVMVGASPVVNLDITNASSATASDGSATANPSGGLSPYSFQWSTGDTDNSIEDIPAGLYSLIVTDAAGCATTTPVEIDFLDAVTGNDVSLAVYPNPAENAFFIEMKNMNAQQIKLVNTLGQSIIVRNIQSDIEKLDVSDIKPGVYFLEIKTSKSQYVEKVFIN
jgi:PKD repeat protein